MSELAITLLRLGYLLVLWLFVFAIISVLRRDLYGTKITARRHRATPPRGDAAAAPGRTPAGHAHILTPPRARLVVVEGPLSGTTIPLSSVSVVIGRAPDCTLVVDDDYASTRHARIYQAGDDWMVEDLGSTNGTFVDGQRLIEPVALHPGTAVRIGQSVIEIRR